MSEPLASYAFLPWLRRGIGSDITRVDGTAGATPRVSVEVGVRFNADDARSVSVDLSLFGPGEVKSLDVRAITRVWPRPGVMDAEPNYFPLVEFDQADLPWRYTPARATAGDRLTPWIGLIVLADDEVERLVPPDGDHLGIVDIKDASALPKWSQLWAWAHVQYSGGNSITATQAEQLFAQRSPALISRLLCGRRMKPRTGYRALIVPTYQRGVLAGLRQPVPDAMDALTPGWADDASGALSLPVYFEWRIGTGRTGDFESLARLIKAYEAPASIGIRDMDVSAASPGMPPAAANPLGLKGMLTALGTQDTPWNAPDRAGWIAALKPLLNLAADRQATPGLARVVTPPLYGQWPAATIRTAADDPNARPPWFQSLSVDPRLRVGAGLGTQVVQKKQESLMASAWQQVDRVRQLNEELRQAQLAREIAQSFATRHVMRPHPESVLFLTAPLHTRLTASPVTVRQVLADSPVPLGVFDGAFQRIARPLGAIGRRQGRAGLRTLPNLLARLNEGKIAAADVPPTPSGAATPTRTGADLVPTGTTADSARHRATRASWWNILAFLLLIVAIALWLLGLGAIAALLVAGAVGAGVFARAQGRHAADEARRVGIRSGTLTPEQVREVEPPTDFVPQPAPATGAPPTMPAPGPSRVRDPELAAAFREAAAELFGRIAAPQTPLKTLRPVDLGALRETLTTKLAPKTSFALAYRHRYTLAPGVFWKPDDPIEPIMAAPEFPQPMYEELKALSPEWILPGLSEIPNNKATLLKTNQAMIESFMVGLNHEMARELLWREYPVEQRATYFRQFWDTQGVVAQQGSAADPEQSKDITRIHTWRKDSTLGTHSPRPPGPPEGYLVLLIRGDLLRRYPNTLVYAARARWASATLREIDDPTPGASEQELTQKVAWPLFSGQLEPDATFFGFALTKEQVKGSVQSSGDPGWFFVLQEHSHEPRFGLDESDDGPYGAKVIGADWNGLSWRSLAADAAALDALKRIDLNSTLPDTTQVTSAITRRWHADAGLGEPGSRASDIAFITFQRPMRVGIHGEDMVS